MTWFPPQTLKIKKCINSMCIFSCKCVILGVICVILSVILQNFPGVMPPDPSRMVVLKFVTSHDCDETSPPSEIFCVRHWPLYLGFTLFIVLLYFLSPCGFRYTPLRFSVTCCQPFP